MLETCGLLVKVDAVRVVESVKVVGLFIEVYVTVDDGSAVRGDACVPEGTSDNEVQPVHSHAVECGRIDLGEHHAVGVGCELATQ